MKTEEIIRGLKTPRNLPAFRVGDTVRTHVRIREGEKERLQVFEGTVIRKRGSAKGASFTVRKVSYGVGVERIFPIESAAVEKIEVVQKGKVRRARLYYLRKKSGKAAQIDEALRTPEEGVEAPAKGTSASVTEPQSAITAQ